MFFKPTNPALRFMATCLLLLAICCPAQAQTLEVYGVAGSHFYTFDPGVISADQLELWASLAPDSPLDGEIVSTNMVNLCIDGEPGYRACGTRDLDDPNFMYNGQVNVDRGAALVSKLETMTLPQELEQVRAYFLAQARFRNWLARMELGFLRASDPMLLSRQYQSNGIFVDPAASCGQVIAAIPVPALQYWDTADWNNCLNDIFLAQAPDYPEQAWQDFLRAYGIEDRYQEEEP